MEMEDTSASITKTNSEEKLDVSSLRENLPLSSLSSIKTTEAGNSSDLTTTCTNISEVTITNKTTSDINTVTTSISNSDSIDKGNEIICDGSIDKRNSDHNVVASSSIEAASYSSEAASTAASSSGETGSSAVAGSGIATNSSATTSSSEATNSSVTENSNAATSSSAPASSITASSDNTATASTGKDAGSSTAVSGAKTQPVCVLVVGMAGSGKSSVVHRLSMHLASKQTKFHTVNLDPAVRDIPYMPFIDIRDTVNYKEVMKQYGLGPNGAIVTSLNLFSTMFEDVLKLIEKREDQLEYVLFDTPGQIEVFNWSASGPIIAGSLASVYPTIIMYVIDTVRSNNTQTFMANMLYACSILYKYKLPFIIAFNKIDIMDCKFAFDWMQDFETFQDELTEESSYASNLTRSLSLALEEFYNNIRACGVSAHTGEGMSELVERMCAAAEEFGEYRKEYELLKALRMKEKLQEQERNRSILQQDMETNSASNFSRVRKNIKKDTEVLIGLGEGSDSDEEELDEVDTEEIAEKSSFKAFLEQQKRRHAEATHLAAQPPHGN